MYRYSAFSLVIDSQVELPELPQGRGDPDVEIRFGYVDRAHKPATIDDEVAFPRGIGGFHVTRGRKIVVDLLPQADAGVVRTLLAGRVMGYLLRQRGYLPLHASAVCIHGKGVLFLGESGSGKSTTAAAFHSRGYDVLADDVAAVSNAIPGLSLQSAWPGLRLLDDSRSVIGAGQTPTVFQSRKHLYRLKTAAIEERYAVKRIYVLEYADADDQGPVRASGLSKFSAVALLNAHSLFRSWRAGHALRQINLDRCAAVADAQTVYRLIRPHSLRFLPDLVDFVERDVQAGD
jgi:hypothetical protein